MSGSNDSLSSRALYKESPEKQMYLRTDSILIQSLHWTCIEAMALNRWRDNDRFEKEYGLPPGRREISAKDLKDKYRIIRKLVPEGTGGLNEGINLVRNKQTGTRRVQKQIDPTNEVLLRELLLLQALRHPNIIHYVDAFIDKSAWHHHTASLYMEFCTLSTAQRLIEKYHRHNQDREEYDRAYIPEGFIWHIFRSLASALQYLHFGIQPEDKRKSEELEPLVRGKGYPMVWPMILHRDIKPENVFFKKTAPVFCKTKEPRKRWSWQKKTYRVVAQYPRVVLGDFVRTLCRFMIWQLMMYRA